MTEWVAPNFRARVSESDDQNKKRFWQLIYADDEDGAKAALEEKEFEVHKVESYDFEKGWLAEATKEKAKAINAKGGGYEFPSIWGELKAHLQDLFYGKCAYCEATFLEVTFGDVEHYRPKGGVKEDPTHPGYYWKAYDVDNYLPACSKCNTKGKGNQFPISGTRARTPQDSLEAEDAQLLNPYEHDMAASLAYRPSTSEKEAGHAYARDDPGQVSINVYRLNRAHLTKARLGEQKIVRNLYKQAFTNWLENDHEERWKQILEECKAGTRKFSIAAIDEINAWHHEKNMPSPFGRDVSDGESPK
jgi:hypothetical protein